MATLTIGARKTKEGWYVGFLRLTDGPHTRTESTRIVRLARKHALEDAEWLRTQYQTTHVIREED